MGIFQHSHFLHSFYDGLNVLSKKMCWIQLSAPLVGIVDGVVSLAILAATIAETIIKGSINTIYGTFTFNGYALTTGLLQLILGSILNIAYIPIPFFGALHITYGIMTNPTDFTQTKTQRVKELITHFESQPKGL